MVASLLILALTTWFPLICAWSDALYKHFVDKSAVNFFDRSGFLTVAELKVPASIFFEMEAAKWINLLHKKFVTSAFKKACDVKSKNAMRALIGIIAESVPQLIITIIFQELSNCGKESNAFA